VAGESEEAIPQNSHSASKPVPERRAERLVQKAG